MSLTAGASGLPIRSKEPSSLGEKLRATLSQRHTVWGQMALLVAGVVLPITLLWACCLWLQYRDDRARIESDLIEQARSAALLVDREFDLALNVAEMLAGAPSLKHGDVGEYRDYVHHAESLLTASYEGSRVPVAINVYDRDGRRLLNAGLSNAPPGDNAAEEVVGAAIASGRNQISNYFVGRFSGQPRVAVVAVVPRDPALATAPPDGLPAAISIALPREHLLAIAMSASRSPGVVTAIRDRNGIAVARSERDGGFFGKPPPTAGLFQGLQGAALIQRPVARPNGTPVVLAAARAPRSGYILALSVDEPVLLAPLRASLLRSAAGGAVALLAGIALAVILASRVSRALHRVLPAAEHAALEERTPEGTGLHDADLLAATLAGHLTERRRAALALLASESRFRTIAEAMPQMVWSATPEGAIEYCNARMLAGTGLTLEQVRAGALWEVVHPEDRAYTMAQWGRSLATGEPYEVEYRLRMADGSYRWMLRRALPVRDAAGEIERWFATCTDISEIVAARESLSRSREQLEAMIEERTRDLAQSQEQLARSARMQALGQLVGGVAHDFNNVLQAVVGGTEVIAKRADDTDTVRRFARLVMDASERGSAITRRMLSFSRKSDLNKEPIDASSLLAGLKELLQTTFGPGIKIQIHVAERLPLLLADRSQLETVLVNLATNARDAMAGRGTLILSADCADLGDGAPASLPLRPGRYAHLAVRDDGCGMDATTLARVGEPFFTTKPVGEGTGLGLSMAHGFAEQSGGGLHIESSPGVGTVVHLWLPLLDGGAGQQGAGDDRSPEPLQAAAGHLVLVDDDPIVLDVTGEHLTDAGFAVRTFERGEPAFAHIASGARVDALISDLSMPGMDGVTLIRDAQRLRPGLPAILCTGFVKNATELAVSGAMSGSFSLLHKPLKSSQLILRLHEVLGTAPAEAGRLRPG